jgi:hypothetical protein
MPQIYNRKIIRIGKTSLGIILPKAWLRYYSLQAGNQVEIVSNGHVTINPLKSADKQILTEVNK